MLSKRQVYTKKDPISHILDRPDTWVGSIRSRKVEEFVVADKDWYISSRIIEISPAIIRMFIEPLSNIVDNVERSRQNKNPTTKIDINIDKESGKISFWNDGDTVPIEIHEDEKCYNHTMIFGQLLTGSNYNDEEERENISGRNGLGIKAVNVFSTSFTVEGTYSSKHFQQTWTDNMRNPGKPVISVYKLKKNYTKVSYTLDFKRFGLEGYTDDILSLYKRLAVDASMITKVPIFLNGEKIPVHSLVSYAALYTTVEKESLFIKTADCEVVVTPSNDFQVISFANGIYTPLGGTHVDSWSEAIFRPLVEKLNKPKKPQLNIGDIKRYFRLFIVASVKNPEFDTQSKLKLEAPIVEAEVKKNHIAIISKWPVMEMIEDIIRAKEMVVLKKSERKKRVYEKVEGLDPANNEGGSKGYECTLILVEGLSAKTYASWGIQRGAFGKKGRDWMGIYSLRGKCVAPETPILLWDGTTKRADKILIGDLLIGGNGYPCKVKKLFSGEDTMYRIDQSHGKSYTVNSQHTLSLKVPMHKKIIQKARSWKVGFFDQKEGEMKFIEVDYFISSAKEKAYQKCLELIKDIPDEKCFHIDLQVYLQFSSITKKYLKGYKSRGIHWEAQDLEFDPYIVGFVYDHIPAHYLHNSKENRFRLLKGIMDAGDYNLFIDQVEYLCRSLGICAMKSSSITVQNIGTGPYVGFEVDGDHTFLLGDFTVTHNCLNCRNSKPLTISKNNVVTDIIKALGIQYGVDYSLDENFRKLRYGRVLTICDADTDGIHITGLIHNMFHALFPTLLKREIPFMTSMQTPIVRVYQGKGNILFYDEQEYRRYVHDNPGKKINKKYYKGLGSSNEEDVTETFGQKLIEFKEDENTFENMNKAFHAKYTDHRKVWLEQYDPTNIVLKWDGNKQEKHTITFSEYINTELIKFSIDDCKRSIPNIMDGLKEGHRKVLYVTFLRNLKYTGKTIKVAQLAGSVSEKAGYHHGEKNLEITMTSMANAYVGSNNIPLLFRDGQYGCLAPETPVLLWDGLIKYAKDVVVGDFLIGDDGYKRTVETVYQGEDEMYEIIQGYGDSYTVNSSHILTLSYSGNRSIFWKESSQSWNMVYFEPTLNRTRYKSEKVDKFISKDMAYLKLLEFKKSLPDTNIFDIKIGDYLRLNATDKKHFKGVKNNTVIRWEKKSVPIDPYIFGMWLGDGNHDGCGFASADSELIQKWVEWADTIGAEVCHYANGKNHENYHFGIRRRGSGFHIAIGNPLHNSNTCIGCTTSTKSFPVCNYVYENRHSNKFYCSGITQNGYNRSDLNPFKELLKKQGLFKNKYIPEQYIVNDEQTRLALLAGLIDTDGTLKKTNKISYYEISQSEKLHKQIIISAAYISGSLGFRINITYVKQQIVLSISGDGIERIPVKLPRKIITISNRTKNRIYPTISVKYIGKGNFNGWKVDRNSRFLLGDFTVTHNSRDAGGKDAAAGRYIWTKLDAITRLIFREEDDCLLEHVEDDGDKVEPKFYVPIIPMILVNGCIAGIGTGWSSSIPCYNPQDIIISVKSWLENNRAFDTKSGITVSLLPDLKPWYRGHTGEIIFEGESKFISRGKMHKDNKGKIHITELPVGMWTCDFVESLEKMKEEKQISNYKNHSTPKDINFTIIEAEDGITCNEESLKLHKSIRTSNMVLFTEEGNLKKFMNPEEIIDTFCTIRFSYYVKRKATQLKYLEGEIRILGNKKRFLQEVRDGIIKLFEEQGGKKQSRKLSDIVSELEEKKYDRVDDSYEYLLRLQISSITAEKIDKLGNDITSREQEYKELSETTEKEIWIRDLDELEEAYLNWLPVINTK